MSPTLDEVEIGVEYVTEGGPILNKYQDDVTAFIRLRFVDGLEEVKVAGVTYSVPPALTRGVESTLELSYQQFRAVVGPTVAEILINQAIEEAIELNDELLAIAINPNH